VTTPFAEWPPPAHKCRRQLTSAASQPTRPPPVLPTPAAGHKHVHASLARRPPQHAEPPPAIPTPAATHQRPSPPDTPAAGLANACGGAQARSLVRRPRPPPTRRAAAGDTHAGSDTPGPLPTRHARRRSCQRRRRSKGTFTRPLPATPPNTQSRRRPCRRRRRHTSAASYPTRLPPVLPTPAAERKHVHASLARCSPQHAETPPAMQTPAATHQRPSPPDTPAAGLSNAGGGAQARARVPCPTPPPLRRAAAGHTDAAGDKPASLSARHVRRRSFRRRDGLASHRFSPDDGIEGKKNPAHQGKKKPFILTRRAQEAYFFPPTLVQQGHASDALAPPRPVPPPKRSARGQNSRQEARRPAR